MSLFIEKSDFDATVHSEILDALTRSDEAIIEICEDRAIEEMRSAMMSRYDTSAIFDKTGSDRHPLVLMFALDIAVYHLFCIHNPQKISQVRKDRYGRAVEWLKAIESGKVSLSPGPDGNGGTTDYKIADDGTLEHSAKFLIRSNAKRSNHY